MKLPINFYLRDDVVQISRDLLGKYLFTRGKERIITGGMITETEAYAGVNDLHVHSAPEDKPVSTALEASDPLPEAFKA